LVRCIFLLAMYLHGVSLRWAGLFAPYWEWWGAATLSILSAPWQIQETLHLLLRVQECRFISPSHGALQGGWVTHSSALGIQTQQILVLRLTFTDFIHIWKSQLDSSNSMHVQNNSSENCSKAARVQPQDRTPTMWKVGLLLFNTATSHCPHSFCPCSEQVEATCRGEQLPRKHQGTLIVLLLQPHDWPGLGVPGLRPLPPTAGTHLLYTSVDELNKMMTLNPVPWIWNKKRPWFPSVFTCNVCEKAVICIKVCHHFNYLHCL
jgi:hypothetical protein